jgi:hypothetical protein
MSEVDCGAFSEGYGPISNRMAERIQAAYRLAVSIAPPLPLEWWGEIVRRSAAVHDALLADRSDTLIGLLTTPADHYLFYGFENLFKDAQEVLIASPAKQAVRVAETHYVLGTLAIAMDVGRLPHPDLPGKFGANPAITAEAIAAIEGLTGQLRFPNPFAGEHGVMTDRGIVSHRAIWALYLAWRAMTLSQRFGGRIVEIGAGLGRAAFFADRFGLSDYTIVDLPMTNVSQAAFLALALGEDRIALTGEERRPGQIAIYSQQYFQKTDPDFDLAINADSFTEIEAIDAAFYIGLLQRRSAALLSINHEGNERTVSTLCKGALMREYRSLFWLRDGYVEEMFVPLI